LFLFICDYGEREKKINKMINHALYLNERENKEEDEEEERKREICRRVQSSRLFLLTIIDKTEFVDAFLYKFVRKVN
jgi:hypothetical protein